MDGICRDGLLPFAHPLMPSEIEPTDGGYFGSGTCGVYVSANIFNFARIAQNCPNWPQDGPRWPQDGPKMAPRWPKMANLGATWANLGPIWCKNRAPNSLESLIFVCSFNLFFGIRPFQFYADLGAILGGSWGHLGAILGHLWAIFGHLGPSCAILGPS